MILYYLDYCNVGHSQSQLRVLYCTVLYCTVLYCTYSYTTRTAHFTNRYNELKVHFSMFVQHKQMHPSISHYTFSLYRGSHHLYEYEYEYMPKQREVRAGQPPHRCTQMQTPAPRSSTTVSSCTGLVYIRTSHHHQVTHRSVLQHDLHVPVPVLHQDSALTFLIYKRCTLIRCIRRARYCW